VIELPLDDFSSTLPIPVTPRHPLHSGLVPAELEARMNALLGDLLQTLDVASVPLQTLDERADEAKDMQ
jgi:hypothetical protein